ncbi:hypothetical protein GCM10007890_01330 [Methylobacterium tardum]|uniref:Uncharacterized protein n=1 Tax=Methylobacterium tardum TaxID=374432 RepID=A0AA37TA09_9HYPH|nr:hypothetical protein GCM10007890_01330 [Methylobacterium tardum]
MRIVLQPTAWMQWPPSIGSLAFGIGTSGLSDRVALEALGDRDADNDREALATAAFS